MSLKVVTNGEPNANYTDQDPQSCLNDINAETEASSEATTTASATLDRGDSRNWFDWTSLLRKSENSIRNKRSRSVFHLPKPQFYPLHQLYFTLYFRSLKRRPRPPSTVPKVRRKSATSHHSQPTLCKRSNESFSDLVSAIREDVDHYNKTGSIPKQNINPFYHRIHLNVYQKLKLGFNSIFILPVRSVVVLLTLTLTWFVAFLATIRLSADSIASKPFPRWRKAIRWIVARVMMRLAFFFAGFHWAKIIGKRASAKEAPILVVAPHSSVFDAYVVILMGGPSIVARADVHHMPLIGKMVDLTQAIYVGRENANSRQTSIQQIIKRARSKGEWSQIFIFPEGTCTNRSSLIKFKLGAFLPGVPVQPVLVHWPNEIDTVTWTFDGIPSWKNFFFAFTQFTNHIQLEFLPVYVPSKEEQNDAELYAHNVQKVMSQALKLPATDFNFNDGVRLVEMRSSPLPSHLASLHKFRSHFNLPLVLHELDMLEDFVQQLPSEISWNVSTQKFADLFNFQDKLALEGLFKLFDPSEHGTLDIRDYLIHTLLIHPGVPVDRIIAFVFILYQVNSMTTESILSLFQQLLFIPPEKMTQWISVPNGTKLPELNDKDKFKSTFIKYWQFAKTFGTEASSKK